MSEQDRFDWNDDADFDSTTQDFEDIEDFQDPLDGFGDYDDVSDMEDLPEMDAPISETAGAEQGAESESAEVVKNGLAEKIPVDGTMAAAMNKKKRHRGISAMGLGFLFTASVLVAGVGIGGAILLAEGVHPRTLWNPNNLLQVDQLLNFADHPLNILYMVSMGVVFLALLGSFKMSKAAMEANRRTQDAENMLERVTALSLDRQQEWQSQEFKEFPPAEAFVVRILGAWRLQAARQKRLMGVEGELHRLEKALSTNSREDLTGRFDHPAVGRLADEMIRYFDARDLAAGKLEEYEAKDQENTKEILDQLQESRQWNGATLDNLGLQSTALDELVGQMDNLARHLETSLAEAGSKDGMTDIIEGIRKDLDGHTAGSHQSAQPLAGLNDLVDQGSKLAFQIAMEVARLGPRGERLLPMSQSLEDLTTGFRKLADQVNNTNGDAGDGQSFRSVHKKLETLAALITEDDQAPWRDLADEVPDFGPAAARISGKLTRMVDEFDQQEDRFVRIGSSFATMTGAFFDSNSIPRKDSSEAPVSSLGIVRTEAPARDTGDVEKPIEMDPFSSSDTPLMSGDDQSSDPDFSASVLPGLETQGPVLSSTDDRPEVGVEEPSGFSLDVDGTGEMSLPGDEEKVYDLEEFDVAPAAVEPETEDADEVFELSDFGAMPAAVEETPVSEDVYDLMDLGGVSLEPAAEPAAEPADEEVYELSDFGMTPAMGDNASADSEEVHDLTDFGAMPLDAAMDSGSQGAPDEEMVYDLSDFSAKPMK